MGVLVSGTSFPLCISFSLLLKGSSLKKTLLSKMEALIVKYEGFNYQRWRLQIWRLQIINNLTNNPPFFLPC